MKPPTLDDTCRHIMTSVWAHENELNSDTTVIPFEPSSSPEEFRAVCKWMANHLTKEEREVIYARFKSDNDDCFWNCALRHTLKLRYVSPFTGETHFGEETVQ